MSDVFISYARPNAAFARRVAEALRAEGLEVWWDDELPTHRAYYEVLEEKLRAATAVIVIWSKEAVDSQWVRAEADLARGLKTLVQVSADGSAPPMPFNQIQCARLKGWRGSAQSAEWRKVVSSIAALGGARPTARDMATVRPRRPARRVIAVAFGALALVLAGAAVLAPWSRLFAPADTETARVAVLPFEVTEASPEAKALAAALADDVRGMLSENDVQTVASSEGTAPQRLKALGARFLLGGSVRQDGDRLSVRVHLEDVRARVTVWSEQFESRRSETGTLRDAVAVAATESTQAAMEPLAQPGLKIDPQTLSLFIKGKRSTQSPQALERGAPLMAFEQVVARAPNFGAARGTLAVNLAVAARAAAPADAPAILARLRNEAQVAIHIHKPTAGAAYDALFMAAEQSAPRNLNAQEYHLLAGMRADPDFPFLPMRECRLLVSTGRIRQGLTYCQRANALNPLAAPVAFSFATSLELSGQPDLADQILAKAFRYHPDHVQTRRVRFELAAFGDRLEAAEAILADPQQRPQIFQPEGVEALRAFLRARRTKGFAARQEALAALARAARLGRLNARYLVLGSAALGDVDAAFQALNDIVARDPVSLPGQEAPSEMLFEPLAAPLRKDPRFWQMAARLGLLTYWRERKVWPDFCSDANEGVDCVAAARAAEGHRP